MDTVNNWEQIINAEKVCARLEQLPPTIRGMIALVFNAYLDGAEIATTPTKKGDDPA